MSINTNPAKVETLPDGTMLIVGQNAEISGSMRSLAARRGIDLMMSTRELRRKQARLIEREMRREAKAVKR